jgi:hypothetical protein
MAMKKIIAFCSFVFVLNSCASAQKNDNEINQKLDMKSGKEIVLVKVIDDSRCPEGVQCIWAGEVTIEVAAYENRKLIEQVQFTLGQKNRDEAKKWFIQHLPATDKELQRISVLPYPKDGVPREMEDYIIKLVY